MVAQLRDYSYNLFHYQLKAGYAYIVWSLKNSRTRGLMGLLKILEDRGLEPELDVMKSRKSWAGA